jgi:quercetin dioxygenase-like cupin family protein
MGVQNVCFQLGGARMMEAQGLQVIAHHFVGGVYAKEMLIPEDHEVISHQHVYDHMSVLTQGCVIVEADGQQETYWSPAIIEIKAGVAHSVRPVNGPAHWLCIHATDCTDESQVDEVLIQPRAHMQKLPFTLPVDELNRQLAEQPELWNLFDLRTRSADSPHREVDDIWLRYRSWDEFDPGNPHAFANEHRSVFYAAYYKLPAMEWLLAQLVERLGEFELGGILITRIPPGKQVYPHSDAGSWHADYYDLKVLVLLSSAPGQQFCFENDEAHEGDAGDVFVFDNRPVHWVVNSSDTDRVSLIFAIRRKS